MNNDPVDPVGLEPAERIDVLCDEFEQAWLNGGRPRIEGYLGDTEEPARSTLLFELVSIEVHHRRRRGEAPTIDEYADRFPQHVGLLSDPSLRLRSDAAQDATLSYREPAGGAVAQFTLLNRLGTGSFGTVWRAHDTRLDRIVALKLPRHDALEPKELEKFLREARAAAQVRHPHIIGIHEVGRSAENVWIASEYVEGVSLKEWLTARRMAPRDAAAFCVQIAHALEHAHENGVIHRDVKPGNIIVDRAGRPHLTDFGLAKRLSGEATLTVEGQVMGTLAYMSPEQADGRGHRVDARADVYSLGVVLYELLCGQRPFQGSPEMMLYQVLHAAPGPPSRHASEVPRDLETICLKALAKEPSRRYDSAAAFAADLQRFLDGKTILARRAWIGERCWRWLKRHRMRAASLGSTLLAASLLVMLAFVPPRGEETRRVVLDTVPSGARVAFVPLDKTTGEPQPEGIIHAKTPSPVRVELFPGDYLVVAVAEGHGFHEVYRTVPGPNSGSPRILFRHRWWRMTPDGEIELFQVEIPDESVTREMARFDGGEFVMGTRDLAGTPPHARTVPPFYLDATEVKVEDFREVQWYAGLIPELAANTPPDGHAMAYVSWDEATAYAERIGKRLPEEAEFEFAATFGGTRRFPWGDDEIDPADWPLGPVGEPAFDRLDVTDPPISGLYSNVAEWTASRSVAYPPDREEFLRHGGEPFADLRVFRGAPSWAAFRETRDEGWAPDPRERTGTIRQAWKGGLGFRCARSARPRLTPEDFVRTPPRATGAELPD